MFKQFFYTTILVAILIASAAAQEPATSVSVAGMNIIPAPTKLVAGSGAMTLNSNTVVRFSDGARDEAEKLAQSLRVPTGLPLKVVKLKKQAANCIDYVLDQKAEALGAEGYLLSVTSERVIARARTTAGLFYATQTIRQLLPVEAFAPQHVAAVQWTIPAVEITDAPRFSWRGMHLDVSRHFYPVAFIRKFIDLLAAYKMNVFHWHLVDDGGWRMESKKYKFLTERGAWRSAPPKGKWDYGKITFPAQRNGTEYGGFYTRDEIRAIVRYAAERHITIVPEIEMPGHTWPSISSYPNLGCDLPPDFRPRPNSPGDNVYCAGKEETFKFIENILKETMELFPSPYIHIGGDEVDKTYWNVCPRCQARMKAEGLKNAHELQSYFIRRIDRFLTAKGRKLIGWDEILEGGLAEGATVMSWRGIEGGVEAVRQGKQAIMSPTSHCYFDYAYNTISTEAVYLYNPVPEAIAEREKMILGAQGNIWTEWMPEESDVERMAFPRALAMAETVWSPKDGKDLDGFLRRLVVNYQRLDQLGVRYRLPQPVADYTAVTFDESAVVAFQPSPVRGLTLRYALDGLPPTSQSPVYAAPIRVTADTDIKAAFFRDDGLHSDVSLVSCRKQRVIDPNSLLPGVIATYYEGEWSMVPDFSTITPLKTAVVTTIDNSQRVREDRYALRFLGYLRIPADGVYTFTLGSDDGSWLRISGAMVINHDGLHGFTEKPGSMHLKAGVYPFEVGFFEAGGGDSLSLWIEGPNLPKQPVTGNLLLRDADSPTAPVKKELQ